MPTENTENQAAERGESNELLALRARSLIADKDMITAQASLDLERGGDWRYDWTEGHALIDKKLNEIFSKMS